MKKFFLIPDRYAHYREDVFYDLGKRLKKKGYESFLLIDENDYKKSQIPTGSIKKIKLIFYLIKLRNFYYKNIVIYQFNLVWNTLKYNPDLIIAWGESHRLSTFILLILCKLKGKKLFLWTHGFYGNENYLKLNWRKLFYNLSPLILLYGTRGDKLLKKYLPNKKTYVIGNSTKIHNFELDFDSYQDILKMRKNLIKNYSLDYKENAILLSFIGRLTSLKKLEKLLDIIKFDHLGNINLWIIGDGPEKKILKKKCLELGIEHRVHFFGKIYTQEEIYSILKVTDIFICPAQLGLSVATALNAGLNVLTCKNRSEHMPETDILIENNVIRLTDFSNQAATYRIINNLYKDSKNISQRKKNQSLSYQYFSPIKHVERIINAIDNEL